MCCARTRVSYRRVQQVHGGSAQAQSVHPVRGLFEIRHHARGAEGETGVWTGRKVQISRCSGLQAPAGDGDTSETTTNGNTTVELINICWCLKQLKDLCVCVLQSNKSKNKNTGLKRFSDARNLIYQLSKLPQTFTDSKVKTYILKPHYIITWKPFIKPPKPDI